MKLSVRNIYVQFNPKKIHLVLYDEEGKYINIVELKLNGEELHLQQSATHLGHPVGECNVTGIDQGKNDLICQGFILN